MDDLEKEIRLMALDNILAEHTCKIYRDALLELSRNFEVPTNVRLRIEQDIRKGDVFFKNGHQSLIGLEDHAGNKIRLET